MRNKRPRRAKRYPFGAIIFVVAAVYCLTILFWPLHAIQATVTAKPQTQAGVAPALAWPNYGQSAIGTTDGSVIGTAGNQAAAPMASITKIVTALTVLETKPLAAGQQGPTITFTSEDAARYNQYYMAGGSIAKADAGMQVTEYQILQGMLISSANNYADALAIWAYGSMDNFLTATKSYTAKHNLTNTILADASGFSPESKSSATDLVSIGVLALAQPVIADIVSQQTAAIPSVGNLRNTNLLLGTDGVIGIKTGTTDEAGSCLLFAAKYVIGNTPVTIVGATLGGPNHPVLARDVAELLASAKSGFQEINLATLNQQFATYKTPWGAEVKAVANKNTEVVTWPGSTIAQKVAASPLKPNSHPEKVGTVTFAVGSQKYKTELVLDKALEKPNLFWRLTHPQEVIQ